MFAVSIHAGGMPNVATYTYTRHIFGGGGGHSGDGIACMAICSVSFEPLNSGLPVCISTRMHPRLHMLPRTRQLSISALAAAADAHSMDVE